MTHLIHPLLLCGGSGTRLWPLSRQSFPKQFARITGETSLFESAARRLSGPGFAAPLIVTGNDFRFIVTEQLVACAIAPRAILIEPEGRNTAPAVLAAALVLAAQAPQALARFMEKPDAARAAEMVASGRFLWNAGIFLFTVDALVSAFRAHASEVLAPVEGAVAQAHADLGFTRLAAGPWDVVPDISIDYAIMEKAPNLGGDALSRRLVGSGGLGRGLAGKRVGMPTAMSVRTTPPPSAAVARCCGRKARGWNWWGSG